MVTMPVTGEAPTPEDYEMAAVFTESLALEAPSALPNCYLCRHLSRSGLLTCAAFPRGIPWEIQSGEFGHDQPHPRDHGIRYEPISREELRARAAELRAEGRAVAARGAGIGAGAARSRG